MSKLAKENFEITVRLTVGIEEASRILKQNGYSEEKDFILEDIYLVPEEFTDIDKYEARRLLNMSVRLRSFIFDPKTSRSNSSRQEIVKKDKIFDNDNNIIQETKYVCRIKDISEAHKLLKSLGYVELLTMKQEAKTFTKDNYEITLSNINGRIYIEMEDVDKAGNVKYDSPETIIKLIQNYNLPYVEGEYYAQKAVDEINEMRRNKTNK